jgi:cholesterol 7-dehydrogenase
MESVKDYQSILNILNQYDYQYFVTPVLILAYWLYYRKYNNYIFQQHNDIKNSSRPRGKCPAYFPNGWFRLLNSDELKVNEVKHFDYCGRDVVVFRGANNKVYALHAFCSHMGANLGKGGVVKHKQCIQCPFHGWL